MDYDIIYEGKVIANIQAGSDEEAERNGKLIYGDKVTVERT